jgi:hypothetical protein
MGAVGTAPYWVDLVVYIGLEFSLVRVRHAVFTWPSINQSYFIISFISSKPIAAPIVVVPRNRATIIIVDEVFVL